MSIPQSASSASSSAVAGRVIDTRPQLLGHPVGLFLLFMVEMWERFSYYGMRALLVLYLTSPLTGMRKPPSGALPGFNPGPGWADADANTLYGWYTGLAYLFPVLGGIIADRLLGTHRSMLVGGVLIMAGHVALAVSGMGSFHGQPIGETIFIGGLALIVLGTGHFKPSVSVMVGQLYAKDDPRRDGAFSIFYMGINLGAFLCAFVCGTLGERVGWHWGFGSAAVGMFLGLVMYMIGRPMYLKGIGERAPKEAPDGSGPGPDTHARLAAGATRSALVFLVLGAVLSSLFAAAFHYQLLGEVNRLMTAPVIIALAVVTFILAVWFVAIQRPEDRGPVASIFIFMGFNAFFWLAFEQAGSSMTLFADRYTDAHIAGPNSWSMPTTWFQSVNPAIIFLFAPVFSLLWTALGKRRMNPSQPVKIGLGLILLGVGFVVLVLGARGVHVTPPPAGAPPEELGVVTAKASLWFLMGAYFFHTMGELCLSPTGLSYVTKAAPARFVSLLMGIWFVSSFIANLTGGLIAAQRERIEKGEIKLPWNVSEGTGTIQADFFLLFVVTSIGAGVVILVLTPLLKKLMRNPAD